VTAAICLNVFSFCMVNSFLVERRTGYQ
jgi:hypothetical protein